MVRGLDDCEGARLALLHGNVIDSTLDPVLQGFAADATLLTGGDWSAVTLLLRHTLLFRSYDTLPPSLAAKGMIRGVDSLCAKVLREGPMITSDLTGDPRHLMGARSYVGAPVQIDSVVVGALCAHSNRADSFTSEHLERLVTLAGLASDRLAVLANRDTNTEIRLFTLALEPAFAGLRNELTPVEAHLARAQDQLQRLSTEAVEARTSVMHSIDAMAASLSNLQNATRGMSDHIRALQNVCTGSDRLRVREIVRASSTLAEHHTNIVGGVEWTLRGRDLVVDCSPRTSISLLAGSLSLVARSLHVDRMSSGISVLVNESDNRVRFELTAALDGNAMRECADALADPSAPAGIELLSTNSSFGFALPAA